VSVVGLHPEELFDKEARNALSGSERVRLEHHVAQCSACRVERQMRADFADEMAGDAARISVSALLAFAKIEKQDRALASGDRVVASAPRIVKASRRRMMKTTWLLAAAAVFAVSVAGATGVGQRAWSKIVGVPAAVASDANGTLVVAKPASKHVSRHASPAPIVAATPPVDVLVAPTPPAPEPVRAVRPALEGAAALFDSASDARRHGDYTRALTLHRELASRFPTSREAHVARATVGRLLLDLGDPSGALASFDEYLASGSGELGEETMVGRATALERLGRADDARRAWQALLAAYPESPYAAHAMRRLGSQSVH
jgi:TolA-binding protein